MIDESRVYTIIFVLIVTMILAMTLPQNGTGHGIVLPSGTMTASE